MELLIEYDAKCAILGNSDIINALSVNVGYKKGEKRKELEKYYKQAEGLSKDLLDCIERGVKLIAIPFNFYIVGVGSHSNMLIYRPDKKTIERFEPHGKIFLHNLNKSDDFINSVLKTMFEKKMKPYLKKYTPKYIPANEVCPMSKGFQSLENELKTMEKEGGGFCNLWSLFFLELMFLNPTLSTQEVLKKALVITKLEPQYIKNLIRGYVKKTEKVIDKFMKRIKDTNGFNYIDYKASKKNIVLDNKKLLIMTDEVIKYYLNIGSKNTQLEVYDEYKKKNINAKDYYEEYKKLQNKYSSLYNYLNMKSIDDLNKVIKKIYKGKYKYSKDFEDLAIKYILGSVDYKPDTEKSIYKLI